MNNQQPAGEAQNSQKKKPFYKKWWFITIAAIVVLSAIFGSSEDKKEKEKNNTSPVAEVKQEENQNVATETKSEVVESQPTQEVKQEIKVPKYEIVYEIKNKRYDGGVEYFVSIDPVSLANDSFKNDVKSIVNQIVKDKGSKISVNIIDDKSTLDLYYKSHYGANTLGRILTKPETDQIGLHLIASFAGEMKTEVYLNTLSFFPATFTDNTKVGKYVGNIEYTPEIR